MFRFYTSGKTPRSFWRVGTRLRRTCQWVGSRFGPFRTWPRPQRSACRSPISPTPIGKYGRRSSFGSVGSAHTTHAKCASVYPPATNKRSYYATVTHPIRKTFAKWSVGPTFFARSDQRLSNSLQRTTATLTASCGN